MTPQPSPHTSAADLSSALLCAPPSLCRYGWGQSFHFAPRYHGEEFYQSLARHEHYLALRLNLQKGERCVDIGCGVGGPLREIARFSQAHVTGLNNNEYQVGRALKLNEKAGLGSVTAVVKGDFMQLPFEDGVFDKAYAIEATCHAPDRTGCYAQIFRVLKEGGVFAGYEWTMTDAYDASNAQHKQWKHGIEIGNSLPTLTPYSDILHHLTQAGFEVVEHFDIATSPLFGSVPWYSSFLGGWSIRQFPHTQIGRACTNAMCSVMETVGLAPKGTTETAKLLGTTGTAIAESGRLGIFTPMFFFIARKPMAGEGGLASPKKAASKKGSKTR